MHFNQIFSKTCQILNTRAKLLLAYFLLLIHLLFDNLSFMISWFLILILNTCRYKQAMYLLQKSSQVQRDETINVCGTSFNLNRHHFHTQQNFFSRYLLTFATITIWHSPHYSIPQNLIVKIPGPPDLTYFFMDKICIMQQYQCVQNTYTYRLAWADGQFSGTRYYSYYSYVKNCTPLYLQSEDRLLHTLQGIL